MALKTLDQFRKVRKAVVALRIALLRLRDVRIGRGSTISLSAKFTGPVRIGSFTYVAFKTNLDGGGREIEPHTGVVIGDNCFIGAGSILQPGTRIGNGCIVSAGAVVQGEVADRTIVAGNPARVIRENIETGHYGVLPSAAENSRRTYRI